MEVANEPEVSVIVMAYNRKEYLGDALNSLAQQTASKSMFEVILITNFEYPVEKYRGLNIRHLQMDGFIGEYLYSGIKEARGKILAFLEDDDLFCPERIGEIVSNFNDKYTYYRNEVLQFRETSEIDDLLKLNTSACNSQNLIPIRSESKLNCRVNMEFNPSSISIKRSLLVPYLNLIRLVKDGQDTFLWFIFLESRTQGIFHCKKLTYYRVHESTSQTLTSDNEKIKAWSKKMVAFYEFSLKVFHRPEVRNLSRKRAVNFRARIYILQGRRNKNDPRIFLKLVMNAIFISDCISGSRELLINYIKMALKNIMRRNKAAS